MDDKHVSAIWIRFDSSDFSKMQKTTNLGLHFEWDYKTLFGIQEPKSENVHVIFSDLCHSLHVYSKNAVSLIIMKINQTHIQ